MGTDIEISNETLFETATLATEQVFSVVLGLQAEASGWREEEDMAPHDGVVSMVTFSGAWIGVGMLCCSKEFACKIGSTMLMQEFDQVDSVVLDGIGEMANMVVGNIKEALEPITGALALSLPTVVFGKNFSTRNAVKSPWVVVSFHCAEGDFSVRICMRPC